jgi:hypothetical protein
MNIKDPKSIREINELIASIEKHIKPETEIGTQSKTTLTALLTANKVKKKAKTFKCRREYSDTIVTHFINKGVKRNRFCSSAQDHIYLI